MSSLNIYNLLLVSISEKAEETSKILMKELLTTTIKDLTHNELKQLCISLLTSPKGVTSWCEMSSMLIPYLPKSFEIGGIDIQDYYLMAKGHGAAMLKHMLMDGSSKNAGHLCSAVKSESIELVKSLLENGFPVAPENKEDSPILFANSPEMLDVLISHGAFINKDIVDSLIQKAGLMKKKAGGIFAKQVLAYANKSLSFEDLTFKALKEGNFQSSRELIFKLGDNAKTAHDKNGDSLLIAAAKAGSLFDVKRLLSLKANPLSVHEGGVSIFSELLVENGKEWAANYTHTGYPNLDLLAALFKKYSTKIDYSMKFNIHSLGARLIIDLLNSKEDFQIMPARDVSDVRDSLLVSLLAASKSGKINVFDSNPILLAAIIEKITWNRTYSRSGPEALSNLMEFLTDGKPSSETASALLASHIKSEMFFNLPDRVPDINETRAYFDTYLSMLVSCAKEPIVSPPEKLLINFPLFKASIEASNLEQEIQHTPMSGSRKRL